MKTYDVITIGSAVRDVFLKSDAFQIIRNKRFETGMGECVSLGSKIEINEILLSSGGGATNAAVTFSQLGGFKTACMAVVGDDSDGTSIKDELSEYGIETKYLTLRKNGQTGHSTLLTTTSGERSVLVYRGVSKDMTEKDIDWKAIDNTKWLYLTSLGGNLTLSKKIINRVKKAGGHVAWNPGRGELEKSPEQLSNFLKKHVDVLNLNREEAALVTGNKPNAPMRVLIRDLHPGKNRMRVITDGSKGAYVCNGATCYKSGTSGAKGKSRTGAGDAFGSGLVTALMKNEPMHTALRIGTLNAEGVIQSLGAKNGILQKHPTSKQLATIPINTL